MDVFQGIIARNGCNLSRMKIKMGPEVLYCCWVLLSSLGVNNSLSTKKNWDTLYVSVISWVLKDEHQWRLIFFFGGSQAIECFLAEIDYPYFIQLISTLLVTVSEEHQFRRASIVSHSQPKIPAHQTRKERPTPTAQVHISNQSWAYSSTMQRLHQ